jgi:hypothetical protein
MHIAKNALLNQIQKKTLQHARQTRDAFASSECILLLELALVEKNGGEEL